MSLLSDLQTIAKSCGVPVETGVFSGKAPDTYLVITPLSDSFELHADNTPGCETHDIAPIIEQIREKQHILIENYPDEFGPHKWSFDLDEWMAEEYHSGRPTYYSKAITEKREAELRELYDKRGQTDG